MDFMRADFENGGKYSDMTLVCGDKKWKVHSAVMCPQSKCMDEEYRTFKTGRGEIKINSDHAPVILGVIQYCYSGKYPEVPGTMKLQPIICHAYLWDFAVEYEMPEFGAIARQHFEEAAGREIGTPQFAKFLSEALDERPRARESCLSIIGRHAGEVFGGSEKYDELCKVIKGDNQFLFELTAHLATHKTERATIAPQKRVHPKEETHAANKLQKTAREDTKKRAGHASIADSKLLDQIRTLRPEDVQCCMRGMPADSPQDTPSTQSSGARDLLKANGFVNFHCPDCRGYFDAKIQPQEKFSHKCKDRSTEHTGAVWNAFFRTGSCNTLGVEHQWWIIFERMQRYLSEHKVN